MRKLKFRGTCSGSNASLLEREERRAAPAHSTLRIEILSRRPRRPFQSNIFRPLLLKGSSPHFDSITHLTVIRLADLGDDYAFRTGGRKRGAKGRFVSPLTTRPNGNGPAKFRFHHGWNLHREGSGYNYRVTKVVPHLGCVAFRRHPDSICPSCLCK